MTPNERLNLIVALVNDKTVDALLLVGRALIAECPESAYTAVLRVAIDEVGALVPNPTWRDISIKDVEFSARIRHCLINNDVATLGEADAKTDGELMGWPNFGRYSLKQLREIISRHKLMKA